MTRPPQELAESQQLSESQRLKARGVASWRAAVAHPMVAGIGAGTLPHEVFRFYFEQNLGYLREYARAIALALAGTTDREAMSILTRFLGQIVDVEIPANESFLTRLGGSPDLAVPLRSTAYSYTRHLLDVCRQGHLAVALAGLLPCQWSYGEIGQRLVQAPPADPVYADWIALFAGDGYGELVTASTGLLDRCGTAATGPAAADAFDRSTRYEVAFWQMAYTRGESDGLHRSRARRPTPHRTRPPAPALSPILL